MSPFGGSPVGGKKLLWRAGLAAGTLVLLLPAPPPSALLKRTWSTYRNHKQCDWCTDNPNSVRMFSRRKFRTSLWQCHCLNLFWAVQTIGNQCGLCLKAETKCGLPVAGTAGGPVTYSAYDRLRKRPTAFLSVLMQIMWCCLYSVLIFPRPATRKAISVFLLSMAQQPWLIGQIQLVLPTRPLSFVQGWHNQHKLGHWTCILLALKPNVRRIGQFCYYCKPKHNKPGNYSRLPSWTISKRPANGLRSLVWS